MPDEPAHPAPPQQLSWLATELRAWQAEGLVDATQAEAILGRYRAVRRFSLARMLLGLGAVFVGFGLIWLVASNLDELSPLLRFLVVAAFWVATTTGAEVLARRTEHSGGASPVVGAARLLAALAFGGVVFQAAQSLQVPAYEPSLVGVWGLGALVQAYAFRAVTPLVVGVAAISGWLQWQGVWDQPSPLTAVLLQAALGIGMVGIAALHDARPAWSPPSFSTLWREVGALWLLVCLFVAALPFVTTEDFGWSPTTVVAVVVATVLAIAALLVTTGRARLEPVIASLIGVVAVLLVLWEAGDDAEAVGALDWLHALTSVALYLVAACAVAVLGVLRESWRLTALAAAGLVVFTTVQSFAVFARIIEGALLFVVLGVVLLASGYVVDRGRRRLAATLKDGAA